MRGRPPLSLPKGAAGQGLFAVPEGTPRPASFCSSALGTRYFKLVAGVARYNHRLPRPTGIPSIRLPVSARLVPFRPLCSAIPSLAPTIKPPAENPLGCTLAALKTIATVLARFPGGFTLNTLTRRQLSGDFELPCTEPPSGQRIVPLMASRPENFPPFRGYYTREHTRVPSFGFVDRAVPLGISEISGESFRMRSARIAGSCFGEERTTCE